MSSNDIFNNFPSDWYSIPLGQLVKESNGIIQTGPFGSQLHAEDYVLTGTPSIMPKNISVNGVIDTDIARIKASDLERLARYQVKTGDIIYSRRGDVEKCALISERENGWLCGTGCILIRVGNSDISPEFLHAYLSHPLVRAWIVRHAIGATMPNLNTTILSKLPVLIPSKKARKSIQENWTNLTKKILINSKVNQTLEQMAQALFKSWFIDFEPIKAKIAILEAGGSQEDATLAAMMAISGKNTDSLTIFEQEHPEKYAELRATAELFPSAMQKSELGEIPEGWAIDNLGKIIEFNPKRILKKGINAPYLDMKNVPVKGHSVQEVLCREVTSGTKFKNGDTLLARITPCLENGKTAFVDFLSSNETVGWGSTEFIVMRIKRDLPLSISYFIARLESFRITAIQSMQGTSGRQRADAGVLQNIPWVIPPDELLVKFGKFSNFVIDNNRIKHNQNTLLSQLRDTLLPKLLSGEITLQEAEEITKEADYV